MSKSGTAKSEDLLLAWAELRTRRSLRLWKKLLSASRIETHGSPTDVLVLQYSVVMIITRDVAKERTDLSTFENLRVVPLFKTHSTISWAAQRPTVHSAKKYKSSLISPRVAHPEQYPDFGFSGVTSSHAKPAIVAATSLL